MSATDDLWGPPWATSTLRARLARMGSSAGTHSQKGHERPKTFIEIDGIAQPRYTYPPPEFQSPGPQRLGSSPVLLLTASALWPGSWCRKPLNGQALKSPPIGRFSGFSLRAGKRGTARAIAQNQVARGSVGRARSARVVEGAANDVCGAVRVGSVRLGRAGPVHAHPVTHRLLDGRVAIRVDGEHPR